MSSKSANPLDITSQPALINPFENPKDADVIMGAGGAVLTQKKTLDQIIGPSQEGVSYSYSAGTTDSGTALTYNPELLKPDQQFLSGSQVKPQNVRLGQFLVGMATAQFFTSILGPKPKTSRSGEELSFVKDGAALSLEEEQEVLGEDSLPLLLGTQEKPETTAHEEGSPSPETAAFDAWTKSLSSHVFTSPPPLPQATQRIYTNLESKNSSTVDQQLCELSKIDTLKCTPKEKQYITSQLTKLSHLIATANEQGGITCMKMGNDFLVMIGIKALLKPIEGQPAPKIYEQALLNLSSGIAKANIEAMTKQPETTEAFFNLFEGPVTKAQAQIESMLQEAGLLDNLPKDITHDDVRTFARALSSKFVSKQKNTDLQSVDKNTLSLALQALIQEITPSPTPTLLSVALPILVTKLSTVNTKQMQVWIYSSDQKKVQQGLEELSGVTRSSLTPTERKAVHSYIQVLTEALAMLAQIRAYIAQLDGMMVNEMSKAKMNNVAEQMNLSTTLLYSKLDELAKSCDANIKAINTANTMRILMPIITLVVSIASLLMMIASLGTATGPALALLVVAITSTAVTIVIEVADLVAESITKKGVWQLIFDATGITDETTRNWIQSAVLIGLGLVGLIAGIGAAAIAIKAALKVAEMSKNAILKALWNVLSSSSGLLSISTIITPMLSAPIFPMLIKKALIAGGLREEEAQTWSMIIMLVVSLLPMIIGVAPGLKAVMRSSAGNLKKVGDSIKSGLEEAMVDIRTTLKTLTKSSIKTSFNDALQKMKGGMKSLSKAAAEEVVATLIETGQATKQAATSKPLPQLIEESTKSIMAKVDDAMKEYQLQMTDTEKCTRAIRQFLQLTTGMTTVTQAIASIIQGVSNIQISNMKKEIAKITIATATIEGMMEELGRTRELGIEAFLKILAEAEQTYQKEWEKLCNQIDDVITGAMKLTTKLHSRGAA